MRKLISILLIAIISLQGVVGIASDSELIFSEDFSSYAVDNPANSFGHFKTNGRSGGTVGSNLVINQFESHNFLGVPAGISYEQSKRCTAAHYDSVFSQDKPKSINLSFYKTDNVTCGVRFYQHNSDKNYYELVFGQKPAWILSMSDNANKTTIEQSDVNQTINNGCYNLSILFDNKNVSFKLHDKDGAFTAGGSNLSTDWFTFEIPTPFEPADTTIGLIGCGGIDSYAYYSDIEVYDTDEATPASKEWAFTFQDGFDTYDLDVLANEIGPWKTNGKRGELQANGVELKVMTVNWSGEDKYALCVPATELFSKPQNFTAADLQLPIVTGGEMEYKFTFKKDNQVVDAFRFMVHNGGMNYYEFTVGRSGNSEPGWSLIKCVNGGRTTLVAGDAGKVFGQTEYAVTLGYDYVDYSGILSWNIVRIDGAKPQYEGGTYVTNSSGSYEDLEPFKYVGESTVSLVSGGQNAKYSYFSNFSAKATESHEEAPLNVNDPESVKTYLERQNYLIEPYNQALQFDSVTMTSDFLVASGKQSLTRMDRVSVKGLNDLDDAELKKYCSRLLTYKTPIHFNTLADLDAFQTLLNQEVVVGNISKAEDVAAIEKIIDVNADLLGIPTDDYYQTMKDDITAELLGVEYTNLQDFINKFSEALVLKNYSYTINPAYLKTMLESYVDIIGYDKEHFSKIDSLELAKELVGDKIKASITSIAELAAFIDGYNTPSSTPVPTQTPKPTKKPTTGGGGGGGGGGGTSVVSRPVPTATPIPSDGETITKPIAPKVQIFPDVYTDHWCYEATRYLYAKGAIHGYEDGSFGPDKDITRAEFLTMLLQVNGLNKDLTQDDAIEDETPVFSDVSTKDWYYSTMLNAYNIGILKGEDGYAYPNRNITREEMAVLINRVIDINKLDLNTDTNIVRFSDDNEISPWAFASVTRLQAGGVIKGNDNRFEPKSNAKRAEAAQILYRSDNAKEKEVINE